MKLLILDNYSAVYRRLIELLGGVESLSALSIARTLAELPDKLEKLNPDIVVLDVDFPDGRSLRHIKRIREYVPEARIYIFPTCMNTKPMQRPLVLMHFSINPWNSNNWSTSFWLMRNRPCESQ